MIHESSTAPLVSPRSRRCAPLALAGLLLFLALAGLPHLALAQDVAGGPLAVALIVGVNHSVDANLPVLHYADDDAVRYDELFRTLGTRTHLLIRGDDNTRRVAPQAVASAREPRRSELAAVLKQIAGDVAAARARGRRTTFYFIYAGHGSLSRGEAYLALEDARLTGGDIEHQIIDGVHADESHLIIDACYSYFLAYGRGPGGARRDLSGFAPVEGLARRDDVGLLLSTTSARESHEWEGFQAGVFSHEVRSGLFGAADFDGDGRVSYREIAAFVDRANAAIPNERFRPDVFARPPGKSTQLLDLRPAPGLRHLVVDGSAEAGRYFLDDTRGVRLADFHNGAGHEVRLLLPVNSGTLYLRRTRDDREYEIPTFPDVITVSELTSRTPRSTARGAAHDAFSLIFSLPFDQAAFDANGAAGGARAGAVHLTGVATATVGAEQPDDAPLLMPRPRWRTIAGVTAAGVAGASLIAGAALTWSAHSLANEARGAPSQVDAAALNRGVGPRNDWARAGFAVAGTAALTSALLLLWPSSGVYAMAAASTNAGSLDLGGRF